MKIDDVLDVIITEGTPLSCESDVESFSNHLNTLEESKKAATTKVQAARAERPSNNESFDFLD